MYGEAISLEAIRIITEEGVFDHLREVAPKFQSRLRSLVSHALIGEARGVGLMGALEMVADEPTETPFAGEVRIGERISRAARQRGLIARPLGSALVLAPPFITTETQIDEMFTVLEDVIEVVQAEVGNKVP